MISNNFRRRARLGTALAALAFSLGTTAVAAPSVAVAAQSARPSETLNLSQNTGTLVRLSSPMSDVFIANDSIADIQVRSSTQLYVFGKASGETTIYATDKGGRVVYAANVRVGTNVGSVDEMLRLAMPEASIRATPMNNLVLLTGTVGSPEDVSEAQRLVQAYVGANTQVVSRLRSATPLQVNLRVKIAEVSRSVVRQIGVNLLSSDSTGGFNFGVGQGGLIDPASGQVTIPSTGTILRGAGKLFGLDIISALELAEGDGLVTTLAEPNLTALSGETASFLAGGEYPIPIAQQQGAISIEYKSYGVGLAFTPIVLADGRISMRVRPEVSELSSEGSVRMNGTVVPALVTRRAETTVELGSGQSFMIAGLLRNSNTNNVDKAPFLGDIPILGALFRSTKYRHAETELVIIVTPYLVRPMSGRPALPTDGYRSPSAGEMLFEGKTFTGRSGPTTAVRSSPVATASPGFKL
ncbi:MAG: type II and III secretion system protein family protein [Pseudomonadota bacterium]|nr:type II and III secretion system protein family protein [Pseudomonadota bacterium]